MSSPRRPRARFERVAGVGDQLQLIQNEAGHIDRLLEEAGPADIRDAAVNDDIRVQDLEVLDRLRFRCCRVRRQELPQLRLHAQAGLHAQVDEDEPDHEHQRLAEMLDGGEQRIDQQGEQQPEQDAEDQGDLVIRRHLLQAGSERDEVIEGPTAGQERQQRADKREPEDAPIQQALVVVRQLLHRLHGAIHPARLEAEYPADDGEPDRQHNPQQPQHEPITSSGSGVQAFRRSGVRDGNKPAGPSTQHPAQQYVTKRVKVG